MVPSYSLNMLMVVLLLLLGARQSLTARSDGRGKIEKDQHLGVFQHRGFFKFDPNTNLHGPRFDTAHFRSADSVEAFGHDSDLSDRLAAFSIRRQERQHSSERHKKRIQDTKSVLQDAQQVLHSNVKSTIEPNITDKETVVNLAKMTSDAYLFDPREPDWLNTSLGYNFTRNFGWMGEGLRGHVFTTEDNSSVIVSFKGTTIDPRDKLSNRDRINDNRLFSCCCGAQNPWHYAPVCNCSTGYNQCNYNCLTKSLLSNDSYYDTALFVIRHYQKRYPEAMFWTVGHSLGGSLASLVGMTTNIPAVTFEAPPEHLAAERIGLQPDHEDDRPIVHHFGNTADPIHMGECNGFFSACAFAGYVFDSKCFSGRRCLYDTKKDKGWRSNVGNHRISYVIKNVLEAYDQVAPCVPDRECVDCAGWNFTHNLP